MPKTWLTKKEQRALAAEQAARAPGCQRDPLATDWEQTRSRDFREASSLVTTQAWCYAFHQERDPKTGFLTWVKHVEPAGVSRVCSKAQTKGHATAARGERRKLAAGPRPPIPNLPGLIGARLETGGLSKGQHDFHAQSAKPGDQRALVRGDNIPGIAPPTTPPKGRPWRAKDKPVPLPKGYLGSFDPAFAPLLASKIPPEREPQAHGAPVYPFKMAHKS